MIDQSKIMAKQKINPSNAEANFFQRIKDAKKTPKSCYVGTHWIALTEYYIR